MAYSYRCADFPGMESCPGVFAVETETELLNHIKIHAKEAHGENPDQWSEDDRKGVEAAIRKS